MNKIGSLVVFIPEISLVYKVKSAGVLQVLRESYKFLMIMLK